MINERNICGTIANMLENCSNEHKIFDERYPADRRYKIVCIAGYGSCSHDHYVCSIGNKENSPTFYIDTFRRFNGYSYYPYMHIIENQYDKVTVVCDYK